jgi:hypothetical protein
MAEPTVIGQWETFYVIVGSSGGALTGLLFVVVALVADRAQRATTEGLTTYATPSIFHFCTVLFLSALIAMPRTGLGSLAVLLGLSALVGGVVTLLTVRRIARFEPYRPVAEDWIWHAVIPSLAYLGVLVAAFMLTGVPVVALYIVAAANLALLFTGVHNAWDAAVFNAVQVPRDLAVPETPPSP